MNPHPPELEPATSKLRKLYTVQTGRTKTYLPLEMLKNLLTLKNGDFFIT
jgi:hypothetical protein